MWIQRGCQLIFHDVFVMLAIFWFFLHKIILNPLIRVLFEAQNAVFQESRPERNLFGIISKDCKKKSTILLLWGATPTTLYPEKPRTSRTSTGARLVSTILSPVLDGLGMPSNTLPEILERKLLYFLYLVALWKRQTKGLNTPALHWNLYLPRRREPPL